MAPPDALYLDNDPLYSGAELRLACERLGITLLHARPYDAPARGKMERFWRTLLEGCLDHLGTMTQLHDVQARLLAFLDEHYHRVPHGGLFGKRPADVWATATMRLVDEAALATALTTRTRRRARRDGTLDVDGTAWQLDQSFLAGALVTVAVDMTGTAAPVPRRALPARSTCRDQGAATRPVSLARPGDAVLQRGARRRSSAADSALTSPSDRISASRGRHDACVSEGT